MKGVRGMFRKNKSSGGGGGDVGGGSEHQDHSSSGVGDTIDANPIGGGGGGIVNNTPTTAPSSTGRSRTPASSRNVAAITSMTSRPSYRGTYETTSGGGTTTTTTTNRRATYNNTNLTGGSGGGNNNEDDDDDDDDDDDLDDTENQDDDRLMVGNRSSSNMNKSNNMQNTTTPGAVVRGSMASSIPSRDTTTTISSSGGGGGGVGRMANNKQMSVSVMKAKNIEQSAGTNRLNRILNNTNNTNKAAYLGNPATLLHQSEHHHGHPGGDDHTFLDGTGPKRNDNNNNKDGNTSGDAASSGVIRRPSAKQRWAMAVATNKQDDDVAAGGVTGGGPTPDRWRIAVSGVTAGKIDPRDIVQVSKFVAHTVVPPLKVDTRSIGGNMLDSYPNDMRQECIMSYPVLAFESTAPNETVSLSALQYPAEYAKHKRSLGLLGGTKGRNKLRFIVIARSTNKPFLRTSASLGGQTRGVKPGPGGSGRSLGVGSNTDDGNRGGNNNNNNNNNVDESERADYETMFAGDQDDDEDSVSKGISNISEDGASNKNRGRGSAVGGGQGESVNKGGGIATSADGDGADNNNAGIADGGVGDGTNDPDVGKASSSTAATVGPDEVSSFPVLICMTLHSDGTAPDIRKLMPLDQLTTIQDVNATIVQLAFTNGDTVRLDFGSASNHHHHHHNPNSIAGPTNSVSGSAIHGLGGSSMKSGSMMKGTTGVGERRNASVDSKERFIWSLLLVHAMLCQSVVERNAMQIQSSNSAVTSSGGSSSTTTAAAAAAAAAAAGGSSSGAAAAAAVVANSSSAGGSSRGVNMYLPPLNVRNLDRADLQYVATVNGFLNDSPILCAMLERQRKIYEGDIALLNAKDDDNNNNNKSQDDNKNKKKKKGDDNDHQGSGESKQIDIQQEIDEMAYDLMMGNFATRVALFHSEEERKDAEEVLNSVDEWTRGVGGGIGGIGGGGGSAIATMGGPSQGGSTKQDNIAAISIGERLALMLQWRMRDLEAETCRRLIAWEDEKHLSAIGKAKLHGKLDERDSVDALALASLFKTLESLDMELQSMEEWLQERAAAIKPLTDDCADIEEENRQLEQQWKSYDMLRSEMKRLLQGLEISDDMEKVLKNPASALVYDDDGLVDVDGSEDGVQQIYEAGKALQDAMEYPRRSGGLHLTAVSERAEGLQQIANSFCTALAQIIVTIMEQFKTDVVAGSDYGKVSKSDTHTMIARKVRDTQKKFQSALLGYIKLIEILAALSAGDVLPALRDAYSEMVSEGILMKKRMKGYFQALPGKNVAYLYKAGKDLKDYVPQDDVTKLETVHAPDIRAALGDLLPVIAREAYFTSALFGSTKKDSDGREKKRNFENTKTAVDSASQNFRYYLNRTCGIVAQDLEGKSAAEGHLRYDPLLCVVASVYLNEAMKNYIDREKKGGDHSLSLAYVRATILDLRKRADKQWVHWVDRQIAWIKSNDGVPLSGKRAGIFPSFARFPCYLDHLMLCCKDGREEDYVPDIPKIKVIAYYLQKMAATLLDSLRECANRETTDRQYGEHVMQMENTYYFTQAIKQRGLMMETLFHTQTTKANAICKESTDAYLGWMIKKEFTVLHELFSRASKLRKDVGDREVLKHISKQSFVKTLTKEASREVLREKIGFMFSRMEKHLSEEGGLLPIAWKALVKVLYEWFGRWEKLSTAVYNHKLYPSAVDVVRIAKAAGGGSSSTSTSNYTSGAMSASHASDYGGSSRGGRMGDGRSTGEGSNEFGFKSILALANKNNNSSNNSNSNNDNN